MRQYARRDAPGAAGPPCQWSVVPEKDVVPRSLLMAAAADRHLLFGLLALQNGIINQGQLVAAIKGRIGVTALGLGTP
jgi:hypothetical protein